MQKENKNKLEIILQKVASKWDLEVCRLNIKTNQNPIIVEITVRKLNGDDISIENIRDIALRFGKECERFAYDMELSNSLLRVENDGRIVTKTKQD